MTDWKTSLAEIEASIHKDAQRLDVASTLLRQLQDVLWKMDNAPSHRAADRIQAFLAYIEGRSDFYDPALLERP